MIHLQVQGSKCNSSTFEMGSGGLFGDMQIFFFFFLHLWWYANTFLFI
jgi:hypothetical protein